ncbi:hypothetical protein ABPG74_009298 [Tetrahymena malaccensis]
MGKLIFALPLAALLILIGTFYMQNKSNLSTDYYTFQYSKWADCVQKLPAYPEKCTDVKGFQSAESAVNNLVSPQSSNALPGCIKFAQYQQTVGPDSILNYGDYYLDCFYEDIVVEAAQTNDCYYQQYFYPRYFKCTKWF